MRLEYGKDTIWNCLRIFSMECDWNLVKTQFGIVSEFFQCDWNLAKTQFGSVSNIFDEMRLEFLRQNLELS